ncbi:B-cell receptor CD22-like [Cololabis saira]|uniref:B-cell receptor CD22-like n=1 Tax=Cololabis saira TaxID=129043 RepID=UPI002AD4AFA9|nr:B-cell receptor CD22-like [Cololabis saira]
MAKFSVLLILLCVSGASASTCAKSPSLFITTPRKMEALTGSCLHIPCTFSVKEGDTFNSSITSFGVWLKTHSQFGENPSNVIFNGSVSVNNYSIRITGKLTEKNCTTVFGSLPKDYTDNYYFRVESDLFKATASCHPLNIRIKDSPWSPNITISGDLKEKERVTITCSAVTPCPHSPPELTWNLQQDSHTQTEKNKDGTLKTKIQKIITLSDTHDGYTIRCSARYPVKEGKQEGKHFKTSQTVKTLNVSYAPKNTSASISPAGLVSAGSWVNLTCSSRANPPVSSFTWFKKREHGDMEVAEGDFYSLNVTDGGVYYCVAMNRVGTQKSREISPNGEGKHFSHLEVVVGGILGIIILLCVIVLIWRLKSTRSTSNQTENVVLQEPNSVAENQDIHYGEVNFTGWKPPPDSVQHSSEEQNVVYAQVKPRKNETGVTQIGDDIYAQVKKK